MKNLLIIENSLSGLEKLNESVDISVQNGKKEYLLGGIFTEFDVMNRNERIYTADKFLPHMNELLERKKTIGVIYGEFDHPDVFDTSLARISHTIESVNFNKEKNAVEGTIRLLNTHYGKEARALVEDNCPIFVSSRAAGVTESNGTVTIKKLFTYDAVADPGFSSAKMSLNESFGFNESNNFRIYDISDESKINELFNMNENDFVTKQQMVEYSNYLTEEIERTKKSIGEHVSSGKFDPQELVSLEEKWDSLHEGFKKVTEYLDYLAENVQVLVDKNKSMEKTTDKIIEHNDYLAESLEKSIKYSDYLAENIDKNIEYSEYIAETLDKNIDFSEYIAENVEKNIKYSEYLAENVEKSIDYAEYIAESLDKSIDYTEYIAENLDKSIVYSEYIAENVDNNIKYAEYVAEHVDNNIKYAEYIAEHVDNNIKYSEYIAENVSDNIAYSNYLAESLDKTIDLKKSGRLNEGILDNEESPNFMPDDNISKYYEEDDDLGELGGGKLQGQAQRQGQPQLQGQSQLQGQGEELQGQGEELQGQGQIQGQGQNEIDVDVDIDVDIEGEDLDDDEFGIVPGMVVKIDDEQTAEVLAANAENRIAVVKFSDTGEVQEIQESRITVLGDGSLIESEFSLNENIKRLITEAKKRKASEEDDPHFLMFLTEKRKASWYNLNSEDKEKVIVAINESNGYSSESDILRIMENSLSTPQKTFEETLIENLPEDLFPIWENLDVKIQQSILNGASFYTNLSESKMENFWRSRGLEGRAKVEPGKTMLNEAMKYDNSKLNDQQLEHYKNRLLNL